VGVEDDELGSEGVGRGEVKRWRGEGVGGGKGEGEGERVVLGGVVMGTVS